MTQQRDPWCPRNCHRCRHVLSSGICSVDLAAEGPMSRAEIVDETGLCGRVVDRIILSATAKIAHRLTARETAWQRINQVAA